MLTFFIGLAIGVIVTRYFVVNGLDVLKPEPPKKDREILYTPYDTEEDDGPYL